MSYSEFNVRVIWIVFPVDAVYLVEWYLFYIKYCRYLFCRSIGVAGFEPTTPCSQSRCANRTALHPEEVLFLKSDAKVVL